MWANLVAGAYCVPTLNIPSHTIDDRIAWLRDGIADLKQYRDDQMQAKPSPRWTTGGGRPSIRPFGCVDRAGRPRLESSSGCGLLVLWSREKL